jgi:hypothetical protein
MCTAPASRNREMNPLICNESTILCVQGRVKRCSQTFVAGYDSSDDIATQRTVIIVFLRTSDCDLDPWVTTVWSTFSITWRRVLALVVDVAGVWRSSP